MAPGRAEAAGPAGATPSSRQLPRVRGGGLRLGWGPGGRCRAAAGSSAGPCRPPSAVLSQAGPAWPGGDGAWLKARGRSGEPARSGSAGGLMINSRRRWLSLA